MKIFFFILGKDWEISLAEISNFFETEDFKGEIIDHSKNCAIVRFKSDITLQQMQYFQEILGGILKIGFISGDLPKTSLLKSFPFKLKDMDIANEHRNIIMQEIREKFLPDLIKEKLEDFFFAVSIYPTLFSEPEINLSKSYVFFNKFLKREIESIYKIKTNYFRYPEKNVKSGEINPIWPHNVHNYSLLSKSAAEIVIILTKNNSYLGRTITADNPNLRKMIDEKRPKSSFSISTPPKLSKILINLAIQNENKKILDCFCGSGTILMMALTRNLPFIGTDINKQMVGKARENIDWLSNTLKIQINDVEKKIFQLDANDLSKFFQPNSINAIVTEPYLGPIFKNNPTVEECEEIIRMRLIPLYKAVFKEFESILIKGGRIVITTPVFLLKNDKEYDLRLDVLLDKNKFKLIKLLPRQVFSNYRLKDVDKNYVVIRKRKKYVFRKINVIEKI
ncbi:MAG: methyltransferase domain-containing protein [Candidatus Lokiarchaeota archaeon]|nr:methyltransferase domain-containing protein [Candidatus Lokiarchaeota archaeon]